MRDREGGSAIQRSRTGDRGRGRPTGLAGPEPETLVRHRVSRG